MLSLLQDLRYGARTLSKARGFTVVALLTLALGIGANTAVFSVVNAALLRPLPYPEAGRIVALWEQRPHENQARGPIAAPDFLDWQRLSNSFSAMSMYDTTQDSITGNGDPERIPGGRVSAGFFEVLGVRPLLGRAFRSDEEHSGRDQVAILTYGYWQRRFGADIGVLGRTIEVNGEPATIVGVLPRDFRFPFAAECELFLPIRLSPEALQFRGIHQYGGIARLKTGVTLENAQAEMALISRQLERQYPDSNTGHAASLVPLRDELSRKVAPVLPVLLGAVLLVVLIACGNVANLMLARAAARRREIAVRAALGCSRWRLVRQSLAESAILATGGAALGILLASWGLEVLRAAFFEKIEFFSRAGLDNVALDGRVLSFTLACAAACTLLFGASPAFATAGVDLSEALRAAGRGAIPSGQRGLRSALVVFEVAFSLVLLTGAGLLAKSFLNLLSVNPGFQPEHTLAAGLTLPPAQYRTTPQAVAFYDRLLERVRGLPGVRSAAVTDTLPLSGDDNRTGISIAGRPPRPDEHIRIHPRLISVDYLRTMGIALLQGRDFTAADAAGDSPVAIISETTARQYWPDGYAVGGRFAFFQDGPPWIEVVGVAAPVHNSALDTESTPDVYLPFRENPFRYTPTAVTLVLRTGADGTAAASVIRPTVYALDRSLPVSEIRSMDDYLAESVAPRRFNLILVGFFAILALVLAAVGLYGVMGYLVSQRTGEIGLRMALGARRADVLRMILGKGLALSCMGVALGLAVSYAVSEYLESLLFGVKPRDPIVFGVVAVVLVVIATLASYLPARRASNVDPMQALRME